MSGHVENSVVSRHHKLQVFEVLGNALQILYEAGTYFS